MDAFRLPPIWSLTLKGKDNGGSVATVNGVSTGLLSAPFPQQHEQQMQVEYQNNHSCQQHRSGSGPAGLPIPATDSQRSEPSQPHAASQARAQVISQTANANGATALDQSLRGSYGSGPSSDVHLTQNQNQQQQHGAPYYSHNQLTEKHEAPPSSMYVVQQNHFFQQDPAALPGSSQMDSLYSQRRFSESVISPRKSKASEEFPGVEDNKRQRVHFWDTVLSPDGTTSDDYDTQYRRGFNRRRVEGEDATESSGSEFNCGAVRGGFASGATPSAANNQNGGNRFGVSSSSSRAQYYQQPRRASYSGGPIVPTARNPMHYEQDGTGQGRRVVSGAHNAFPSTFGEGFAGAQSGARTAGSSRTQAGGRSAGSKGIGSGRVGNTEDHDSADDGSEKPYNCTGCAMTFTQRSALKCHVRVVHQKERPFKCELCNATFGHKGDLNRHHMTKHEQLRPFKCEVCGAAFGRKSVLNRHAEKLHGMKPAPQSSRRMGIAAPNSSDQTRSFPPRIAPNPYF